MLISLGYLSIKMIVPLLIPILYGLRHYLLEEFDQNLRAPDNNEKRQSVFLNTFIVSISYSLNIFLFIFEYKQTKSTNKQIQEKEFDNQLLIEKKKMEKKLKKSKLSYLILISLFNFFNLLFYDIVCIFKPSDYNKNFFYTLSIPIYFIITAFMSFLFLNKKIYVHQKVSMITSPILSLMVLSILIALKPEKSNTSLHSILYLIECLALRSLRYVLVVLSKLFMDKMFVTHIKLMTFLGIFGIIFSLIANSFSFFIKINFIENPDLNEYFEIYNGKKRFKNIFDKWGDFGSFNWLYFVGSIILWFFENYIVWFCIYEFSPNHYTVYASINSIIVIFIDIVEQNTFKNLFINILSFVALFIIFICGLIFNEIIIIRVCKMDKYTNVEINKRQKEDTKISMVKFNENNNNENPDNSFDSENEKDRFSSNSLKS